MKRYCWLDINTGKFSGSWDEKTHELCDEDIMRKATEKGWKLIEYTYLNDRKFEFYPMMRITSNNQ